MKLSITQDPEIVQHLLMEDEHFPNNPALPLLIYKKVLIVPEENGAKEIEKLFKENEWSNSWCDDIFPYHHYHSNTHEVLGALSGRCIVQFGGEHGVTEELNEGDVVIIPAGVAHKKIVGENFMCVGAYPKGKDYNIRFGAPGEKEIAQKEIAGVPLPTNDPVFGKEGAMKSNWKKNQEYAQ